MYQGPRAQLRFARGSKGESGVPPGSWFLRRQQNTGTSPRRAPPERALSLPLWWYCLLSELTVLFLQRTFAGTFNFHCSVCLRYFMVGLSPLPKNFT